MFWRSKHKSQMDTLREQLETLQSSMQDVKDRMADLGGSGSAAAADSGSRLGRAGSRILSDTLAEIMARMSDGASSVGGSVGNPAAWLGDRASGVAESVSERASKASDRAASFADSVSDQASKASGRAASFAETASRKATENVTGQRLGTDWSGILIGIAVAAGALGIGMLFLGSPKKATDKIGGMWNNYRVSSAANGKSPSEHEVGAG